jgi:hypothetical protein
MLGNDMLGNDTGIEGDTVSEWNNFDVDRIDFISEEITVSLVF